jgi:hypothetical protein
MDGIRISSASHLEGLSAIRKLSNLYFEFCVELCAGFRECSV